MASPNSGEYYVRSSYTPQQKSTISPYEEVIFPLSISKEERQQQYQTPVQHSTSNRNSRVRFSSDTKPVTPDDGSAVAMAPAVKPGKRNAKRRLFGPVNDDHTAFSPVDDLYKAPEISSVPLDSRVTLYDKGWYTTTSSSSATRALSPTNFFVGCCKPPRRTLVSERLLRNRQSLPSSSEYSIIKRAEIEPHPIRYFVEVYHSGKPQIETKRKQRFMARKDVDFVNPNELNRDYYNFPKDVCYDWDRTECSRDPEPLPLKQFSTIYWFGGNSKQGNAKPVGIKGQNIIVSSDVQQGEGERIIITEASTSQQSAATKEEEPRVVQIIEEKPVITVRQEEGKTVTTIETTTVITTTENFESGLSEVIKEESLPIQSSTPLHIESVQDIAPIPPIESEQVTVIETTPKSEELDAVPIKKYSNVYHSGTSLENTSPMEWVKKKRGILFIKKSSATKSRTSSSTVEEPQPSTSKETTPESLLGKRKKSSSAEPIVAKIAHEVSERARTFSMSKHYPEVSKPYEGQLKEIHRNPEAPSANLFDCVSFVEKESITDEPKTKKAKPSRAARFCLACVGGNRQRGTERKASKEIESSQDPRLTTEGGIHVEDVYTYEPTKVTEIHETVETVTKTEKKKYDKIPEVIVTHDLSLIPATSEEEIQQTLPLQIEVEQSDLSQHVETITAGPSYHVVEEDTKTTKSTTIPPTPTPSEATNVEEYTRETSVHKTNPQKATELSGYPSVIEAYRSEVDISNKNDEAPHENQIEEVPISTQIEENEKRWDSSVTREHQTVKKEKLVSSAASAPQTFTEKTAKEETVPKKTISKRTKMLAEKKHYPLIGTSSEGHVSELQRKEDFKESNLFDTISFISDSDDSGLGADSGSKRKSGGLICIPKSKKSNKTKTSEIEKINYTEVQAKRNKKVKRARLFSFSKDYPEIGGEIYESELNELKPIQEAKFTNLFDKINFAPDEQSVEIVKQENVTKSKSTGLWCMPTGKKQKRTTSVTSIKVEEESVKNKIIEKAETYSLSKYYPEVGVTYEGELSEITPAKDSAQTNIFDSINFLPKEDKIEILETEKQQPDTIVKEKSKSSGLWCGPTSKKRTTSITSEESIKKGTLNALQIARNKAVEKARTFSFSKDYPEIGGEIYEGELNELAPVKQPQFTNLFDEIDFASDEKSVKIKVVEQQKQLKPKKDTNLICMKKSKRKISESSSVSSLFLQDHKNLNAMQIARNKIVRRTRYFSTSKHYPEIRVPTQEGELIELKPVEQAQFTNLFDEIDFASDEENVIVKTTEVEKSVVPSSNKLGLCVSFKTSKRYPESEEPYTGIVHDTSLKQEVESADLFKCINFASSNEQQREEEEDKVGRMQSEERQPRKQMATLYFRRNTKQFEGYPLISEAYAGEVINLLRRPELETTNLFDCVSFASESDDEIPISQSSNARDSSKKGSPDEPKKKQLRLFGKTRRSTSDKELDLTLYPKTESYSGPLDETTKANEMNRENLRKYITIYHSGYSQPFSRHRFIREKHEGVEEIGEAPADYEIAHFTAEETTPLAPMSELEGLPLRSYSKYPIVSISESPRDMKRKFSKSKIIPESSSESSSQSESETDTVPSLKPSKKKENEGFLSFFRNRLSAKQQQRKRTGYEGLMDKFAGTYDITPKGNEMLDQPILEHVLVYHNGNSTQQPIDSGFEDGANASETERAGTFKRTGKLFFDKFKLSRDSGDKTTTEEIDKSESLEPKRMILTGYENLNTEPFLGLHSSTVYKNEIGQQPLTSTIDSIPTVYFYEGDATLSPVPTETTVETKVSTLERIIKSKKQKKDSNFAYEFLSIEGPTVDTDKKDEINNLPIGEHVTVYHCGRSDVPTAEVPPEVYVYEKEPISESLQSLTAAQVAEPQGSQIEHVTLVKKTTKRESLKPYPEPFTYEGPIESLERLSEAGNENLNEYVNIYHSGLSTDTSTITKKLVKQESKTEKQPRRSILGQYSFDTTPYEGAIEETSVKKELEHLPLQEHAFMYHAGISEVQNLEDLEDREKQVRELSLVQRIMAMFKKRELQGYPSMGEEYIGPMGETNRAEDVEKSEIKNITNIYHSGYSYDPKTSKLTLKRFAPKRRFRLNMNDYPKDSAPIDAVIYDLHATEDIPKTPSPVTLPPESLIFDGSPKERQQSKWYRFWFLRRRGEPQSGSSGLEPSMPIIVESMSHRITDTSASIIMGTTDRSLFTKGHWPVTDIDVDVMLKTITKCHCECEALIIEKSFETGIGGSIQLQQHRHHQKQTLNDTSFRMDNNCIMQTSNGTWLAKVTKKISTQMEQKTDCIEVSKKAELYEKEEKNELNDEVLQPSTSVVKEKEVEGEDEIEVSRNSNSYYSKWDCEPPYLWSSDTYNNLEELIDDDELNIISKESGELPLTHEKKELEFINSSVRDSEMFASIRRRLSERKSLAAEKESKFVFN
uniref:Uncharacterized protein n=1 Tax=Panagrolaimus davidi TaxID=227884 RepID=A0A914PEG7_9BILA